MTSRGVDELAQRADAEEVRAKAAQTRAGEVLATFREMTTAMSDRARPMPIVVRVRKAR